MIGAAFQPEGDGRAQFFLGLTDEDIAVIKARMEIEITADQLKDFGLDSQLIAISVFWRATDDDIRDKLNQVFPALEGRWPQGTEIVEVRTTTDGQR